MKNATFTLDGVKHELSRNKGNSQLHGGIKGFDRHVWTQEPDDNHDLVLSLISPDMEQGYPGELRISVIFDLNDANQLVISYAGTCDQSCPISLTNHSYFNLSGFEESIHNHEVKIEAERTLIKDEEYCVTGESRPVEGCLDFRAAKMLAAAIELNPEGIDDYYVFREKPLNEVISVANIYAKSTGIALHISTNEPGMQLYTANYLDGQLSRGPNTKPYDQMCAFCCETQRYPNGPNLEDSPGSITWHGDTYESQTIYEFKW
jgi:aldose 1-epimerase